MRGIIYIVICFVVVDIVISLILLFLYHKNNKKSHKHEVKCIKCGRITADPHKEFSKCEALGCGLDKKGTIYTNDK